MSQFPPPVPPSVVVHAQSQRQPANVWATVSLICGIMGCLVVTPLIAVVTGLIGIGQSKRRGGRGTALAGMALGVLWLVAFVLGCLWVYEDGSMAIARGRRPMTVELINRLPEGKLEGPNSPFRIGNARAKELADIARPLGACRDVVIKHARFSNRDDVFGVEYQGDAIFEHGRWPVAVRVVLDGNGWSFTELDLQ